MSKPYLLSTSPGHLARQLQQQCGSTLIAITHGSQSSVLANENHVSSSFKSEPHPFVIVQVIEVPAITVDRVVDTTGAGDAFLGGIIAGDVIMM